MKTTLDRKEIQKKLKFILSNYVNQLIKDGSKKIKKSIKKASKSIAKALVRKIEESDGQLSLQKNIDIKKARLGTLKSWIKKRLKPQGAKRKTTKPVQKIKKPKSAIQKSNKVSGKRRLGVKSVQLIKKQPKTAIRKRNNVSGKERVIVKPVQKIKKQPKVENMISVVPAVNI